MPQEPVAPTMTPDAPDLVARLDGCLAYLEGVAGQATIKTQARMEEQRNALYAWGVLAAIILGLYVLSWFAARARGTVPAFAWFLLVVGATGVIQLLYARGDVVRAYDEHLRWVHRLRAARASLAGLPGPPEGKESVFEILASAGGMVAKWSEAAAGIETKAELRALRAGFAVVLAVMLFTWPSADLGLSEEWRLLSLATMFAAALGLRFAITTRRKARARRQTEGWRLWSAGLEEHMVSTLEEWALA